MASKFSKTNQPVACRDCGKLTTRQVGGCAVALCASCLRKADLENDHLDGNHDDAPHTECHDCAKAAAVLVDFAVALAGLVARVSDAAPAPFASFGSRYMEQRERVYPDGSKWRPREEPFVVRRLVEGNGFYHGWDVHVVTCADEAEARALMESAAKLPRTTKVEIQKVRDYDRFGRVSGYDRVECRKVVWRAPKRAVAFATR